MNNHFLVTLSAGAILTVILFAAKLFLRRRFSWFAIPLPLCIAWIAVSYDWVWLRFIWNQ